MLPNTMIMMVMMKNEKYYCDHCKKEIVMKDGFNTGTINETISLFNCSTLMTDLCRDCYDELVEQTENFVREFCNAKN